MKKKEVYISFYNEKRTIVDASHANMVLGLEFLTETDTLAYLTTALVIKKKLYSNLIRFQ